jgi:hypothetical protein
VTATPISADTNITRIEILIGVSHRCSGRVDPRSSTGLPAEVRSWRGVRTKVGKPMIVGEIQETPDPQRLAIYDKLYAKILARLKE